MTGFSLEICDLSVWVRLGFFPGELTEDQEVRISLALEFPSLSRAFESDEPNDLVCYAKICELIRDTTQGHSFKTLEHLAATVSKKIEGHLASIPQSHGCHLEWTFHKVRPIIDGLLGGVKLKWHQPK